MSRVVHWAQNRSIWHYATGFEPQLMNPIWAELAILNLRLFWGNDQLANLVQWFSMVACLVGISALASLIGADYGGQLASAVFAMSIPMGILQATSTQNDLVVAIWLICIAYFTVLGAKRDLRQYETLFLGMALGLGLLTKGTFYPYAVPFGLWYFVVLLLRRKEVLLRGGIVVTAALLMNLGFWVRNINSYGNPLGASWWIQNRTADQLGVPALIAALMKNTLLNFATPYEHTNALITAYLQEALRRIGQGLNDFQLTWGWNHEDLAGNPLHFILVPFTILILAIFSYRRHNRLAIGYGVMSLFAFVMLSWVVTYDHWGIRYQLPFLITWAPMFGLCLTYARPRLLPLAITVVLIVFSLPWLIFNRSRPVISMRSQPEPLTIPCTWQLGCTIGSIFREKPSTILFANWIGLRDPYVALSEDLRSSSCRDVGLRIDSHDIEYAFWYLLDAPQSGFRLESIYTFSHLQEYVDNSFQPCAIICTICGERTQLHGLSYTGTYGNVRLYQGNNRYTPEEGP
jgi:hypothetical protein